MGPVCFLQGILESPFGAPGATWAPSAWEHMCFCSGRRLSYAVDGFCPSFSLLSSWTLLIGWQDDRTPNLVLRLSLFPVIYLCLFALLYPLKRPWVLNHYYYIWISEITCFSFLSTCHLFFMDSGWCHGILPPFLPRAATLGQLVTVPQHSPLRQTRWQECCLTGCCDTHSLHAGVEWD